MLIVPSLWARTLVQSGLSHVLEVLDFATMHPTRLLRRRAALQSARFVIDHMQGALSFYTAKQALTHAMSQISLDGSILEFGVFKGGTIRHIARTMPDREIHGFDSFEGIPTAWAGTGHDRGAFHAGGKLPRVPGNVRLHRGLFDQTLPAWARDNLGPIAMVHIDSDLYQSARTILDELEVRLVPGVVIVFDDYFCYPGWQHGEHKAFQEFIEHTGRSFRYLCHAQQQVAVQIVEDRSSEEARRVEVNFARARAALADVST